MLKSLGRQGAAHVAHAQLYHVTVRRMTKHFVYSVANPFYVCNSPHNTHTHTHTPSTSDDYDSDESDYGEVPLTQDELRDKVQRTVSTNTTHTRTHAHAYTFTQLYDVLSIVLLNITFCVCVRVCVKMMRREAARKLEESTDPSHLSPSHPPPLHRPPR